MTKSNRDAAGTMGGNVLDMAMVHECVAKLSDNAGPTPTVIESRTYAAGEYPDPEVSRRAERAEPLVMAMPVADPGDACLITIDESRFTRDRFGKRYARESFTLLVGVGAECAKLAVMAGDTEAVVEMGARACAVAHGLPGNARIEWATLEAAVSPMPAGRWTVSHPDPATKARLEAELNATGGCFTTPGEVGSFSIKYTPPAHDPALTVSLAPPESECIDLSTLSNEDIDRLYGKWSWAAENMKWAKARPLGEIVAIGVTGEQMGAERREPANVNVISRGTYIPADDPRPRSLGDHYAIPDLTNAPRTTTLTASPTKLRALADAIGQAIETGTGVAPSFNGGMVTVARDELRFSGAMVVTLNAIAIAADTRALHRLRKACLVARETGRGTVAEWGKGASVEMVRRDDAPEVAAPPSEAAPVRYDGNAGGARAWRWEVGE